MVTKDLDYHCPHFLKLLNLRKIILLVTVLLKVYVAHRLIVYSIIKLDTETPLQRRVICTTSTVSFGELF